MYYINKKTEREEIINSLISSQKPFIAMVLDIMNIGYVNYKYGVLEGDLALNGLINFLDILSSEVSVSLDSIIYEKKVLIIKLDNTDTEIAKQIILRIVSNNYKYDIGFRGGYSLIDNNEKLVLFVENINKVIKNNRYIITKNNITNLDLSEELLKYKQLITDLILDNKKSYFKLVYQPKVNAKTGEIVSCEALARWEHPELGIIPTSEFMNIVRDLNIEYEFDMFILEGLCKEIQNLNQYLSNYSINMSVNTLKRTNIHNDIHNILKKYAINPKSIVIEILEDKNIDTYDEIINALNHLTEFGVRISIDDFGSGYSSYHRLCFLNFSEVKIPREFLLDNSRNTKKNKKILCSIVQMCKSLGCKIVSEGIETKEDFSLMKEVGIDYAQGYYFSKPLELSLFTKFMENYIVGGNKSAIL